MADPSDFDFHLRSGGTVHDRALGIQKMPVGYHLLLDKDEMFFTWMERATGRESEIHWNKWAVWRGAKADAINTPDREG